MYRIWWWNLLLIGIGFLVVRLPAHNQAVISGPNSAKAEKQIICEDSMKFWINEFMAVETTKSPASSGDLIVIEKKYLRLTLYREGEKLKSYTVAIGKPETPTPVGEWKIVNKGVQCGDAFGAKWMGLNVPWGTYGIHGTNRPGSIGYMASHGCIRMHNRNVIELYNMVNIGTPVHIIGNLPKIVPRNEFKRKVVGEDVQALQFALRKLGFDPGPADARYGQEVERVIYKLQYYYGLAPTGIASLNEQYLIGLR